MKFKGYRRTDGRVGVRNHVAILPGVLCSEVAARKISAQVPGTTFIYNPNGCGQCNFDTKVTLDILSGMISNGNVFAALIVGLGCETIQKSEYMKAINAKTDKPVYYIGIQEEGGIGKTVEAGVKIAEELIKEAAKC